MKKKEKETLRKISNVKKNLGKDQETMEKFFKKNEKETMGPVNLTQEISTPKLSDSDIDMNFSNNMGPLGSMVKDGPGSSKIPVRAKSLDTNMDGLRTVNDGIKTRSPNFNPKDKLTGRFMSWEQAKLRKDQDTVIYPNHKADEKIPLADDGNLATTEQKSALALQETGSGLKYGRGPLADRLKSHGINVKPISEGLAPRNNELKCDVEAVGDGGSTEGDTTAGRGGTSTSELCWG